MGLSNSIKISYEGHFIKNLKISSFLAAIMKVIFYRRKSLKKLKRFYFSNEQIKNILVFSTSNLLTSIKRAAASSGIPCSSVHKILHKKLNITPYKISHLQQLFDSDLTARNVMNIFLSKISPTLKNLKTMAIF